MGYILSILEGEDESQEEKNEGITGLLSDILDDEAVIEKTLNEILTKWTDCKDQSDKSSEKNVVQLDITEKMHQITQEKLANFTINKVEKTEEEKKLKEAILHGYAETASVLLMKKMIMMMNLHLIQMPQMSKKSN